MPITTIPIDTKEMTIDELSVIYDRIYDIADRLFKKYNPCNIHTTKTGVVVCNKHSDKIHNKYAQREYNEFLCCSTCKYLSISGCTIKCLPCKLFLCSWFYYDNSKYDYKDFKAKLKRLRDIATKYGILVYQGAYFRTKEEVLQISKDKMGVVNDMG